MKDGKDKLGKTGQTEMGAGQVPEGQEGAQQTGQCGLHQSLGGELSLRHSWRYWRVRPDCSQWEMRQRWLPEEDICGGRRE